MYAFKSVVGCLLTFEPWFDDCDDIPTIQYQKENLTLDLVHTYVDPIGRGKGIGALMCDFAFQYAEANGTLDAIKNKNIGIC